MVLFAPVSYTHLDVYKRQVFIQIKSNPRTIACLIAFVHGKFRTALGLPVNWLSPVSYTHLDVYKRQEQICFTSCLYS